MHRFTMFLLILLMPIAASALEIFVCEPEWGSLLEELAGDNAEITVATTAFQDPHRLQARPSLIAAVRRADLVVCTGADLEIGWLPLLLRRSGNAKIQTGNPGYFLAANFVRRLEIPKTIDRAQGDVHPQGNPHIHLNPGNIRRVADALAERLTVLDAGNSNEYQARLEDFQARWQDATERWEDRALQLEGMRLASHHRSFSYLADWLDLDIVATRLTPNPPLGVIRTPYENEKPSMWLAERLELPEIKLPYTIGGTDNSVDLFSLYDETIRMLEEHNQ